MQDYGVNLICVEDGIDSSKEAGKLMISVLSAVAEIERENIRVQTMEGRMQKAREGKMEWHKIYQNRYILCQQSIMFRLWVSESGYKRFVGKRMDMSRVWNKA